MEKTIYVQLLGEGTVTYRPVLATKINNNTYLLRGEEIYDPEDENWEFEPGVKVKVDAMELEGEKVLVAISKVINQ